MIVNQGKLQFIIINRRQGKINPQSLIINSNSTESPEDVIVLGIDTEIGKWWYFFEQGREKF